MKQALLNLYHAKPIYNHRMKWFLLLASFVFVILRLPSVIEPHWYGDEGIYQVIGRALNDGRLLYRDIWDNKPPILYIIYAIAGGNLFFVKFLSLIAGLISILFLYKLSDKIFAKKISVIATISVYAILFGSPVIEGNIANAENFMLLPVIVSAYLIYSAIEKRKTSTLILAGLLLSLALMTKIVAVFDFMSFLAFLIITGGHKWKDIKPLLTFGFSFISIFIIFIIYFLASGIFVESMSSIFLQNISYVGEQNGATNPTLAFASKILILIIVVGFILMRRKMLSKGEIFIYLWTAFSFYSAFFSARPYTHYLLVILPAFTLLIGSLFEKKKYRVMSLILIITISCIGYFHFKIYKKNISYYQNATKMIFGYKSITEYERFFDGNTPRDYSIANFIRANVKEDETIFLWSDSAQIYALSDKLPIGKYIVAYHITFYKNADVITLDQLEKSRPKYIIQTVNKPITIDIISAYQLKYIMEGARIYERKI